MRCDEDCQYSSIVKEMQEGKFVPIYEEESYDPQAEEDESAGADVIEPVRKERTEQKMLRR